MEGNQSLGGAGAHSDPGGYTMRGRGGEIVCQKKKDVTTSLGDLSIKTRESHARDEAGTVCEINKNRGPRVKKVTKTSE